MQSSRIKGCAQREDLTGATSAGAWKKLFPSFSRRTHGCRTLSVALLGIICTQGGDEKGPCDYLGELLECIVMQSRCHSTFTFQASEEECVHVWKLASYTWLEATGTLVVPWLHPGRKNERPLTSWTGWASIKFCPRTPSYCLSQARERQQEEKFLHRRIGKGKRAQRWTSRSALVHRSMSSCGGVKRSGVEEEPRDESCVNLIVLPVRGLYNSGWAANLCLFSQVLYAASPHVTSEHVVKN